MTSRNTAPVVFLRRVTSNLSKPTLPILTARDFGLRPGEEGLSITALFSEPTIDYLRQIQAELPPLPSGTIPGLLAIPSELLRSLPDPIHDPTPEDPDHYVIPIQTADEREQLSRVRERIDDLLVSRSPKVIFVPRIK